MQTGYQVLQSQRLVPNASCSSLILKHSQDPYPHPCGMGGILLHYVVQRDALAKTHDGLSDRNTAPASIWLGHWPHGSMHTMKLAVKEQHNHDGM